MKNNRRKNYKTAKGKRYSELEKFAYMLGRVNLGLDKGGNKVTDSYEKGNRESTRRSRKPII